MKISKRKSLAEAVALIPDGATIVFGGWTVTRKPMAAAYEIIRQGKKDLHLVTNPGGPENDLLIGAGCVKMCETNYIGHEVLGHPYCFRHHCESFGLSGNGYLHDDWTVQTGALRLLAGAMGIPFMPTRSLRGTDIINPEHDLLAPYRGLEPKLPRQKVQIVNDPFWEEGEVVLVPALKPDFAIMHVQMTGDEGTVRIHGGPFLDYYAAMAAKTTIVTAEHITSEEYLRVSPELNVIPKEVVDVIVEVPYGAHPTPVDGMYDTDSAFFNEYILASKNEIAFKKWLSEWVFGIPDHMSYLEKLGVRRLLSLRTDPALGYNPALKRRVG
ncbi:CoA transferase subunit A [Desulfotomaculum copahuensis]|uniref:CoA-transferase n=1 Tax=Desulfotomaculum copahuensis TaxID=1838280 RepID=A0A1B7LID7_9FIRM|nr:CoA-transferase [Desulfotomaculum copahuensis]OAT86338.1 hypothetical protein A6M21_03815 [Desulfotomaculum copahuensis]